MNLTAGVPEHVDDVGNLCLFFTCLHSMVCKRIRIP